VLFAHAADIDGLRILNRTAFEEFSEDDDGIVATVRNLDTGTTSQIHADFIVGCDGARSLVRKAIDASLQGTPIIQRVQSTYIHAPGLLALMDTPAWMTLSLNPRRCGTVVAIDGRENWLIHNHLNREDETFESVDRDASIRAILTAGRHDGRLRLQLSQLTFQVGLEPAAVLPLEGPQLVDLALQERTLLLERAERLPLLLLGLPHQPGRVLARLADDPVPGLLPVAHVLVVQLLRQRQHPGGGFGALAHGGELRTRPHRVGSLNGHRLRHLDRGRRRCRDLDRNRNRLGSRLAGHSGPGELADSAFTGAELRTQFLVLLAKTTELVDHLVEEVIDLVLVVTLSELRRLEALVDNVLGRQRHLVTSRWKLNRKCGAAATPPYRKVTLHNLEAWGHLIGNTMSCVEHFA
jgi:hypothetical protein